MADRYVTVRSVIKKQIILRRVKMDRNIYRDGWHDAKEKHRRRMDTAR